MGSVWRSMVVLTVVAMATAIGTVGADDQQLTDCIGQLAPSLQGCLEAVGDPTKKPSSDCCKGVNNVVKNQLKCLCTLYNNPSAVSSYGLNMTRVLEIPTLCKVPADVSLCKTGNSSTPSSHTPAKSAPSPASASVPAPTSGSDKQTNGALRLTWSLKPLWALGLLWASLLLKPWA
ncbi:non-specific lipid transfer protein GPI-anchored 7-like [Nymphaea colorata]|nr:non-specific lipid transfer protein GPI-anchored 7-like [Nymphaea colorata]